MTLGSEKHGDRLARHFLLVIAEQGLRRPVQRQDAAGGVENEHAVSRRIENRGQLLHTGFASLQLKLERLDAMGRVGFRELADEHQTRRRIAPLNGCEPRFNGEFAAVTGGHGQRRCSFLRAIGFMRPAPKQARDPAIRRQRLDIAVTEPIEEHAVRKDRPLAPVDENADRQLVQDPNRVRRGTLRAGRGHDFGGAPRLLDDLGRIVACETGAERASDLAKGASFGDREARLGFCAAPRGMTFGWPDIAEDLPIAG